MTTIEHPAETVQPDFERPIFLAENGRRARILGIAAKVAFVLTALWLVALAAGMVGFGNLPGTSLKEPFSRLSGGSGDSSKQQAPSGDSGSVRASAEERSAEARVQATIAKQRALAREAAARARSSRSLRPVPALPAQRPGQAIVAQQPRQQGWTRRGYVVPPGQVRSVQPPVPPPAQPGNGGRVKKTTPITPPPPPPPPPGNGNGNGGHKPQ